MSKYYLSSLLAFFTSLSFSQNPVADSLLSLLKSTKQDTTRVNILNDLFLQYEFTDDIKSQECLNEALVLSEQIGYKKGTATTYTYMGYFAEDKGDFSIALKNYMQALNAFKKLNNKKGIGSTYNFIGIIYCNQGNYPEALKNHFASLKIKEEQKDKKGMADSYINIGLIYTHQANYSEALKNYLVGLKTYESLGWKSGLADSYLNLGILYRAQGKYEEGLKSYLACLEIYRELDDKRGLANAYNNLGNAYADQGNYPEALKSHFASLSIREERGDNSGIASCYINIGDILRAQNKNEEARTYFLKAKELSKRTANKEYLRETYKALAVLDSAAQNFKSAFENHKLYILYRDSLDNEETRKQTIQSQMNYDFEKKEAIASAEHKKELENQEILATEKSRKQKIIIVFVVCGLILVLIFAGFIFRSLKVTRKQKDIIEIQKQVVENQKAEVEQQKHIVEEHQKSIIDSIKYARRIQQSLLPTELYIEKNLIRLKKK